MTIPVGSENLRQNRVAVLAAFFAQGFVFVSATLSIPQIVRVFGLDPGEFSMFLLGMVLAAAVGSAIAEVVARRAGSAVALRGGLLTMVPALALMFVTGHVVGLAAGMVLYGIALGMVDAGSNMQAVTLERRYARPILPSSQGAWTLGGLVATGVSLGGVATLPLAAGAAFAVVPLVAAFAPFQGKAVLTPEATVTTPVPALPYGPDAALGTMPGMLPDGAQGPVVTSGTAPASPSPDTPGSTRTVAWAAIAPAGIAFLIFYLVDSAAQAWGPLYLDLVLDTPIRLVALATLPYLVANLLVRLAGDHLTARFGAPALVRTGAMIAFAGLAAVVLAPAWPVAAAGFFLTGLGLGAVAPLSFSAAGRLAGGDRARADVVVARFNQLNYVGALLGSVVTGLISTGSSLRIGFALPLVLVLALIPLARGFGDREARPQA
ncbi:MFS transporter [Myceligenerans xiligouense]|nr:MFS transporter [Myceligenerans xiligouense]